MHTLLWKTKLHAKILYTLIIKICGTSRTTVNTVRTCNPCIHPRIKKYEGRVQNLAGHVHFDWSILTGPYARICGLDIL